MSTASVMLMNSSFLLIVASAPRTLPPTSSEPRCSTQRVPEIFPYSAESVSTSWTRVCQILGIEDLHFHDLRHDGVSRLFEMDWDIPRVASVSGHRDWNSMRRYTHLRGRGDAYANWDWLEQILQAPVKLAAKTLK